MDLRRRVFAGFASMLLLQLSLLGSGTLCALQHQAEHGGMRDMGGSMVMTGTATNASSARIADSDSPDSCRHGSGNPCGGPWSDGTCSSAGCAQSRATAAAFVLIPARTDVNGNHSEPRALLAGPVIAPDSPPPRA